MSHDVVSALNNINTQKVRPKLISDETLRDKRKIYFGFEQRRNCNITIPSLLSFV